MNVLVTGATGFTGKNLTNYLLTINATDKVKVIVRDRNRLGDLQKHPKLEIFQGNIWDNEVISKAMIGVDRVFHVAAIYRTSGIADQVYWDTHVKATNLLLEAAKKEGVKRFIHTSTVGVHGDVGGDQLANEESPYSPGDIYQKTKLEAELNVHKFHSEYNFPVAVIRPTAIYGPGDDRLLKLFKLASYKISPILGKGKIKYHMVYIDDLIQGYMKASETDEAIGKSFIIGGEEVLDLNQLLDTIGLAINKKVKKIYLPVKPFQILGTSMEKIFTPLGISPPIYRRRVDFFTKSRAFDITRAKNILGYKPKISLEEGIKKTADWYKQQGLL